MNEETVAASEITPDSDTANDAESNPQADSKESLFTDVEVRVLACLMEKQLTTPDSYPLTLNSLMLACNQKTNRHPKMKLNQGELGNITNNLSDDNHVRIKYGSRANKYSHALRGNFYLDRKQQAIMCVLMLREPLTINDIAARTARMVEFDSNEEIENCLKSFMTRATPLVQRIAAGSGRREDRYTHTFCGSITAEEIVSSKPTQLKTEHVDTGLENRVAELEARVKSLEEMLDQLTR